MGGFPPPPARRTLRHRRAAATRPLARAGRRRRRAPSGAAVRAAGHVRPSPGTARPDAVRQGRVLDAVRGVRHRRDRDGLLRPAGVHRARSPAPPRARPAAVDALRRHRRRRHRPERPLRGPHRRDHRRSRSSSASLGFVGVLVVLGQARRADRGRRVGQQRPQHPGRRHGDTGQPIGGGRAIRPLPSPASSRRSSATSATSGCCGTPRSRPGTTRSPTRRRRHRGASSAATVAELRLISRRSPTTRSCVHDGADVAHATGGLEPDTDLRPRRRRRSARSPAARRAARHGSPPSTTCTSARPSAAIIEGDRRRPGLRVGAGRRAVPRGDEPGAVAEIAGARPRRRRRQGRPHDRRARRGVRTRSSTSTAARSATGSIHVRGNHDAYHGETYALDGPARGSTLPGVRSPCSTPSIPGRAGGGCSADRSPGSTTLGRRRRPAGARASATTTAGTRRRASGPTTTSASTPTTPSGSSRSSPGDPAIVGYFAGHTHRNRVRRFAATGDVPWVEVACVKDYPGRVGRVPGLRGRRPAGAPPDLDARGAGLVREDPRTVRRALPRLRVRRARATAASPCAAPDA